MEQKEVWEPAEPRVWAPARLPGASASEPSSFAPARFPAAAPAPEVAAFPLRMQLCGQPQTGGRRGKLCGGFSPQSRAAAGVSAEVSGAPIPPVPPAPTVLFLSPALPHPQLLLPGSPLPGLSSGAPRRVPAPPQPPSRLKPSGQRSPAGRRGPAGSRPAATHLRAGRDRAAPGGSGPAAGPWHRARAAAAGGAEPIGCSRVQVPPRPAPPLHPVAAPPADRAGAQTGSGPHTQPRNHTHTHMHLHKLRHMHPKSRA